MCVYQAADLRPFHTNPLVYRGVMYLTASQATIALDAATCRVQWRHVWKAKAKENWPQSRGVALKVWHYQAVPHDLHDWDLTQVSPLFTAQVGGTERRLVSVVGKDGLLHVLDRESREHLYEVAVTRRENVDLPPTPEGVRACPGPLGGVQWNGPAFNPRTNTLYVASVDWCGTFRKAHQLEHVRGRNYMGGSFTPDPGELAPRVADRHRRLEWRHSLALPIEPAGRCWPRSPQRPAICCSRAS